MNKETAIKIFPDSPEELKTILIETFGVKCFNIKITDQVKTFEDALKIVGEPTKNVSILLDYNGIDQDMLGAQAQVKLSIIARALNQGWKPNWNDSDERKWYPWFTLASGFGFSGSNFNFTYLDTSVGSRLCLKSEELASYAGTQFLSIYKDLLTLNN